MRQQLTDHFSLSPCILDPAMQLELTYEDTFKHDEIDMVNLNVDNV